MELLREYFWIWLGSNTVAILFLLAAIWKPKLARLLFVLLFAWAAWINYSLVHNTPEAYLDYARITPFDSYRNFINGWFTENSTLMVTLIAIGQGAIALGMLLKGWLVRLAAIGAIIFLLAISPLGVGAGFPFSLTAIAAIYFILKKDDLDYLWKFRTQKNLQSQMN